MYGNCAFLLSLVLALSALVFCQTDDGLQFEVTENSGSNKFVGRVFDSGGHSFNFTDEDCNDYFTINATTSEIRSKKDLDREEIFAQTMEDNLNCIVMYTSDSNAELLQLVRIRILDINDETPTFFNLRMPTDTVDIRETISPDSTIIPLQPIDNDKGLNGTVVFGITDGNDEGFFRLDTIVGSSTIWLLLAKELDSESPNQLNLTITLTDMGVPEPLSSVQTLLINIQDQNNEMPNFVMSAYFFNVSEVHMNGTEYPFGSVTVMDSDSAEHVNYRLYANPGPIDEIILEYIGVDAFTGDIYLKQRVDYEGGVRTRQFRFDIEATDPGVNHRTEARVTVDIFDANDEPPHFIEIPSNEPVVYVSHSVDENNEGDINLTPLRVIDDDSSPDFRAIDINDFSVVYDPPNAASFTEVRLANSFFLLLLHVCINDTLDRETTPEFELRITLHNIAAPFLEGTVTVHIQVMDENDNNPEFIRTEFTARVAEGAPLSKEVLQVLAVDPDDGENGTVLYSIASVSKPEAGEWFEMDPLSGAISVHSMVDYSSIDGSVVLTVAAHDNGSLPVNVTEPFSSNATVLITISPAITFLPRSYQEFTGYNVLEGDSATVYFEFRTTANSGLLLYQIDSQKRAFSLVIENGEVRYQYGSALASQLMATGPSDDSIPGGNPVSSDEWYSVLIHREQEVIDLQVWATVPTDERSRGILLNSSLAGCDNSTNPNQGPVLFVGGIDVLSFTESNPNVTLPAITDFVGSIRNLIIATTQLDLACPSRERNIAIFSAEQTAPTSCESVCSDARSTGCVDYGEEAFCNCLGGFSPQACQRETDYAPISFEGSGRAELSLGYSFFYDLALHSDLSTPALVSERRRRETAPTVPPTEEEVLEVVRISFRPKQSGTGLILYSETQTSYHILQIKEPTGGVQKQSLIYMVSFSDGTQPAVPIHIPLEVTFTPGRSYTAIVVTTGRRVSITVLEDGILHNEDSNDWELEGDSTVQLFAQAPQTNISIGGVGQDAQTAANSFNGCITSFSINGIEVPLSGMVGLGDGGGGGGLQDVTAGCDLCDIADSCPANSTCTPNTLDETFECPCNDGFRDVDAEDDVINCEPVPTTTEGISPGPEPQEKDPFPLHFIIVAALGGVVVVAVLAIVFVLCCRFRRREKEKHTYRVSQTEEQMGNGHVTEPKPNLLSPRDATHQSNSSIMNDVESVMTYQQHDIGDDEEMSIPPSFPRRRSTTSAETGFHTGSERASIPRMDDSGNEKETDYSPFESDSEDLTTSCVEEVLSPSGINLVSSMNGMIGAPFQSPLTPKERKVMTPLRPDSRLNLSLSEMEYDTDMDLSYPVKSSLPRTPRGSFSTKSSAKGSDTESGHGSALSTPKWYKSSTVSDNERESQRAHTTRAYYPTRSEPFQLSRHDKPPMGPPPEYRQPPRFSQRKTGSPQVHYPTVQPPRRESTRSEPYPNAHPQMESMHSPYSEPQPNAEHVRPSVLSKSQPLRFQMSDSYMRQYSDDPTSPRDFPPGYIPGYARGYSSGDMAAQPQSEQQFQDLKSVSRINPIAYWEMQSRMKSTVDQVDPYHLLSEPYVRFEDVSSNPSVDESQTTIVESDGPEHQEFSSQGGGEATADILDFSLMRLREGDIDSMVTDGLEAGSRSTGGIIAHFPSADCSDEYVTLVASSSGNSTPKQLTNGFVVPSSQEPFDV